jgi:tripartite motif-containing protein 71
LPSNHRVQIFKHDGTFVKIFGGRGSGPGQFSYPSGITFDLKGNCIIVDEGNNRIQVFEKDTNKFLYEFGERGDKELQFADPFAATVDNSGNIVVSESVNQRIQIISPDGKTFIKKIWAGKGSDPGQLNGPIGVSVDYHGNLVVCDAWYVLQSQIKILILGRNHRMQLFDAEAKHRKVLKGAEGSKTGDFGCPWGVSVDNQGNIIMCDKDECRIQIMTMDGRFLQEFGSRGNREGQMQSPMSATIDKDGHIVVADYGK